MKYISKIVVIVAFFSAAYPSLASPPAVSIFSLPDTTVGAPYSQIIRASGGASPYTWSIASGSLPPGLILDDKIFSGAFLDATYSEQDPTNSWTDSGNVDGKRRLHFTSPSVAEGYGGLNQVFFDLGVGNTYKVSFDIAQIPDMNQGTSIGIRVLVDDNLVLSDVPPSGHYEVEFEATTTSHTVLVRVLNNTLGAGRVRDFDFYNLLLELVDLAPGNFTSARVSGTPTIAGTYPFEVQVTDVSLESDSADLSIVVGPPPSITTTSLLNTTVGAVYSQTLEATGGVMPYFWSVIAGSLPDGLTINSSTGEILGTVTVDGVFSFAAQIADDNSVTDSQALSITVNAAPTITTLALLALPGATVNDPYSLILQATGGEAPLSWSVSSGSLPTGLSLNSSTGEISGEPTVVQTTSFTIQATDAHSVSSMKAFNLRVNPMPAIVTSSLPAADAGASYSQALQGSGGAAPYVWSILNGSLPPGLTLSNPTFPDNFLGSTYSEQDSTDSWADSGTVDGKRRLHFVSCLSGSCFSVSGDYGELNQVFTGLQAGNTYKASFDVNQNPDINQGTIIATQVLVDGNLILEGPAPSGRYVVEFVATGTSHTVSVRIINNRLGNGRVRDFDFYNLKLELTNLTPGNLAIARISGIPTTFGTYPFEVQVMDANNVSIVSSLHIAVGNTPASNTTVTVGPLSRVTISFPSVTHGGQTTVTTNLGGQPPPTGFKLGTPATYYGISTTAQFTAPVQVCISWTEGQFNNENNLKLWHFDDTNWTNITESGYPDTVNNRICGLTTSFSDFAIFEKKQIVATIDIKPGASPNTINLGSHGTVAVAIFSTATFDVRTVDPLSVTLAGAPVRLRSNGTPMASFQNINNDGLLDLVVHVSTQALQFSSAYQVANLVGYTSDNTEVIGSDTVGVTRE